MLTHVMVSFIKMFISFIEYVYSFIVGEILHIKEGTYNFEKGRLHFLILTFHLESDVVT